MITVNKRKYAFSSIDTTPKTNYMIALALIVIEYTYYSTTTIVAEIMKCSRNNDESRKSTRRPFNRRDVEKNNSAKVSSRTYGVVVVIHHRQTRLIDHTHTMTFMVFRFVREKIVHVTVKRTISFYRFKVGLV